MAGARRRSVTGRGARRCAAAAVPVAAAGLLACWSAGPGQARSRCPPVAGVLAERGAQGREGEEKARLLPRRALRQALREDVRKVSTEVQRLLTELDRNAASAAHHYHEAKSRIDDKTASYYRDDSVESLVLVCVINCLVLLALALGIGVVRAFVGTARLRELYAPRLSRGKQSEGADAGSAGGAQGGGGASSCDGDAVLEPPELGNRMLRWPASALHVRDSRFLFSCGIDAFVLCRIALLGLRYCALALPACMATLVAYGWDDPEGKTHYGANRVSLCNVSPGAPLLWLPVALSYYLIILACVLLWQEERIFAQAYRRYLTGVCVRDHPLRRALRTVLVEDLPEALCNDVALKRELEGLLGVGCVEQVVICPGRRRAESRNLSGVWPVNDDVPGTPDDAPTPTPLQRRSGPRQALHVAGVLLYRGARAVQSVSCCGATKNKWRARTSALVTFKLHRTTLQAVQVHLSDDFSVSRAPYPSDTVEANVGRSRNLVRWRRAAVDAVLAVGLLLWSVPVTSIQAVASMTNMQIIFGVELDESTHAYAVLTRYLPVMAWLWLLSMLQGLFWAIAEHYEGFRTYSEIQLRTMHRYWAYTVCTIYVTVLSGSVLDAVGNVLERPRSVILFLGQSMPQVSVYFVSLVLSKALLSLPVSALRPGAFISWAWCRFTERHSRDTASSSAPACAAAAPWAASEQERFVEVNYGKELPDVLLVFTVCATFGPMAPVVVLAGAAYFGVALVVYRFGALYSWRAPFQGQGRFFSFFLSQALGVLPTSVLALFAALTLLKGYTQAFALLPLLGATLAFRNGALAKMKAQERLPLRLAQDLDVGLT